MSSAHTGATLAYLSVFSSSVKCWVKYCREGPNLQEVHFVAPVRFFWVANTSAGGGELDVVSLQDVAHGVFAEVDGLDRATR